MTRCSESARHEPLLGTAPYRRYWWVIEHPGPWPAHPIGAAVLGTQAPWAVEEARRPDTGVLLVRRAGVPSTGRVWWADTESAHLAVGRALSTNPPELVRVDSTLTLVCTHGRRDRCCAILGRPMLEVMPEAWESTHIGGHRFAPTILLLPWGIVLGRVGTADWEAVGTYGPLALPYLRGRTCLDAPMQVVDGRARHEWDLGLRDVIDITLLDGAESHRRYVVRSERASAEATVAHQSGPSVLASCGAEPTTQEVWRITEWRPVPEAPRDRRS